jgi:hypothetical protein
MEKITELLVFQQQTQEIMQDIELNKVQTDTEKILFQLKILQVEQMELLL